MASLALRPPMSQTCSLWSCGYISKKVSQNSSSSRLRTKQKIHWSTPEMSHKTSFHTSWISLPTSNKNKSWNIATPRISWMYHALRTSFSAKVFSLSSSPMVPLTTERLPGRPVFSNGLTTRLEQKSINIPLPDIILNQSFIIRTSSQTWELLILNRWWPIIFTLFKSERPAPKIMCGYIDSCGFLLMIYTPNVAQVSFTLSNFG